MSPGYWVEACEVLTAEEFRERGEASGPGLWGQPVTLEDHPEEFLLGDRVRFVVEREELTEEPEPAELEPDDEPIDELDEAEPEDEELAEA